MMWMITPKMPVWVRLFTNPIVIRYFLTVPVTFYGLYPTSVFLFAQLPLNRIKWRQFSWSVTRNALLCVSCMLVTEWLCTATERKSAQTEDRKGWRMDVLFPWTSCGFWPGCTCRFCYAVAHSKVIGRIPGITAGAEQECLAALLPWTPSLAHPQGQWCHYNSTNMKCGAPCLSSLSRLASLLLSLVPVCNDPRWCLFFCYF